MKFRLIKDILRGKISFIELFLPFYILLAQYSFLGINSYGNIILISVTLFYLFFKKRILCFDKNLLIFFFFVVLISTINIFRIDATSTADINHLIMVSLTILIFGVHTNELRLKNFFKVYLFIGIISMIIMYYQSIMQIIFNIPAVPITILPVRAENIGAWNYFSGERPSGLYTEPQAYASFMLPLLLMALKYRKHILAHLISISILLSTSSLGILMVLGIYAYKILWGEYKILFKVFMSVLALLGIFIFVNSSIFEYSANKIATTDLENNIRLIRGFHIFYKLNTPDKLFGIGMQAAKYVYSHISEFPWAYIHLNSDKPQLAGYMTSIAGIMVNFGLFSGFLLWRMFFRMWKFGDKDYRLFLIVIIVLSFGQTMLFNAWFILFYLIYLGITDKEKYPKNFIYLDLQRLLVFKAK